MDGFLLTDNITIMMSAKKKFSRMFRINWNKTYI